MDLQHCLTDGSIKTHQPSRAEIHRLLAVADRDLKDASIEGLSDNHPELI